MCLFQNVTTANGDKVGMEGGFLIVQKKFQTMVQAEQWRDTFSGTIWKGSEVTVEMRVLPLIGGNDVEKPAVGGNGGGSNASPRGGETATGRGGSRGRPSLRRQV